VRIKKDQHGEPIFYTWTGPKEEAKTPDHARPKKARKKRTIQTEKIPNLFPTAGIKKTWEEVLRRIDAKVDGVSVYPLPPEYRKPADGFLKDRRMEKAYRSMYAAAKDGKDVIPVFASALYLGLLYNPNRPKVPPPLAGPKKVLALRDNAEELVKEIPVIQQSVASIRYRSNLWFHAAADFAQQRDEEYPVEEISDERVIDALRVARDFLSSYVPQPRGKGRPPKTDQNRLMLRLEGLFKERFGHPLHAVIALFLETVCGGTMTATEVKTSLPGIRKLNRA